MSTMFENHRKSLIQHCELSELRSHFEWTKVKDVGVQRLASESSSGASYVHILSGQKFIKNTKNGQFWRVFENLKLAVKQCYQTGQF